MTQAQIQQLFTEAKCYLCLGISMAEALKLALLARTLIALVPTASTAPAALNTYAQCYSCYGLSEFDTLELALLDQIAQAV